MSDEPQNRDSVGRGMSESEWRASLAAIREGLADAEAGRGLPLAEGFAELRKELGISEQDKQASGGR